MSFTPLLLALTAAQAMPNQNLELDAPHAVITSLVAIQRPLGFAGECTDIHPRARLDAEYERLENQFVTATSDAQGIWPTIEATTIYNAASKRGQPWQGCSARHVEAALKQARVALDAHSQLFRDLTARMNLQSAWAGPLQLCRANVESAKLIRDSSTGRPALSVRLTAALKTSLARITELSVGRQLPIRLDGAVIARPIVSEPIVAGEFEVSGPADSDALTRLAERAAAAC